MTLRERGIDLNLNTLDPDAIAAVLRDVGELSIDVNGGTQQVRITCHRPQGATQR